MLERVDLVLLRTQEVEESDDCSLELSTLFRANRDWGERLPEDDLADVGRNEERDTGAEAVALLEQLVEEDDDDAGQRKLEDDQGAV